MPSPTRVAYTTGANGGTSSVALTNPSGATAGDRILAFLSTDHNAATISNLQGWTLIRNLTYNTRSYFILERDYASSYTALTLSSTYGIWWSTMAIRATSGYALDATVEGATWRRIDNGGSINTTQAPSVSAPDESVALALCSEVSTGAEIEANVTLSGTGWTKWFYLDGTADVGPNQHVSYKDISTAAASGTATTTWPNNSQNSSAQQLVIGQTALANAGTLTASVPLLTATLFDIATNSGTLAASVPKVSASIVAQVTTGRIGSHGCFNFGDDYLVIGHDNLGGSVHEAVLYDATVTTELDRATVTKDGTTGWGSATFTGLAAGTTYAVRWEVDGAEQADAELVATTLDSSETSFVAIAGSCQFTASNHPIFDRMRETNPAFLAHMGDLHYEDATTEPAWRAGVEASLTTARMTALLEAVPMNYCWDNHDIIRTSPLGGGSATCPAEWKQLAGSTDWASSDSVGRAWRHGRVLFIHTDLRSARDNYQTDTPPLALMGATQKTWFKNLLTAANADGDTVMVVWFTSWTSVHWGSGRWGSYTHETAELEAHINSLPLLKAKLVQIGGDFHNMQADSGARNYTEAAFKGVPSLNIAGFNRSETPTSGFSWDIGEASLRTIGQAEADWGGYSRLTFDDDGNGIDFLWEAVRVNAAGTEDIMASWSHTYLDSTQGTLAASVPRATASIAGTLTNPATLAAALPKLTGSATGAASNPAVLSATQGLLSATLTGSQVNPGTSAPSVPKVTSSIVDTATNPGAMSANLPKVTSATTGTLTNPAMMAAAVPLLTGSVAGTLSNPATASAAVPRLLGYVAEVGSANLGTLSAALPKTTAAVAGGPTNPAVMSATMPTVTSSTTGTLANVATMAAAVPLILATLAGTARILGTLGADLPTLHAAFLEFLPFIPAENPRARLVPNRSTATLTRNRSEARLG